MKNFILKLLILFIFYPELLFTCNTEYSDCFNCSSCGSENLELCPCQWNSNSLSCSYITPQLSNNYLSETFSQCIDAQSSSIQKNYCGPSKITINKEYSFYMPKVNNEYGTKSIYCSFEFIVSNNDNAYYYIYISKNRQYNDHTQLNLQVIYKNFTSSIFQINYHEYLDEYFHNVKSINLNIYFVKGYSEYPFNIRIEEIVEHKKDSNTLFIILGIVISFFILSGILCFIVKKHSQKERQRQHRIFERELARHMGEGDEEEINQRKNIEKINKLKIKYILAKSIKDKSFNKTQILKEKKICSICIERIKLKGQISITSCNHIFHYKCLSTWLYKNIMDPKCPNCQLNLINELNDIIIMNSKRNQNTNGKNEDNSAKIIKENDILRLNNNCKIEINSESRESFTSRNKIAILTNLTYNSKEKQKESNHIVNSTI